MLHLAFARAAPIVAVQREPHLYNRAASSAGRAPRSQRGGREFEPPAVHQYQSRGHCLGSSIFDSRFLIRERIVLILKNHESRTKNVNWAFRLQSVV